MTFSAKIVPMVLASDAYKNHGAIILWDESESDGVTGDNADDFNHTTAEIVISPRAHANVDLLPYASPLNDWHSSNLRTLLDRFRVGPFLNDATNAIDLSDFFQSRAVPKKP